MERPNVIILSIDCLRADAVYDSSPDTPFFKSLCNESVVFQNHYATGGWTAPSFVGMMTGEHPRAHSRDLSITGFPETLASSLSERGYDSFAVLDANFWISAEQGFDRGFDDFNNYVDSDVFRQSKRGENDSQENKNSLAAVLPDSISDRYSNSIDAAWNLLTANPQIYRLVSGIYRLAYFSRSPSTVSASSMRVGAKQINRDVRDVMETVEEPFLGWAHYMDAHHPYIPDRDRLIDRIRFPAYTINKTNALAPKQELNSDQVQRYKRLYDQTIKDLDTRIGSIVADIQKQSFDRDTVIVLVGDHGDEFGEHGRVNHANRPYNELLHTPLIVATGEDRTIKQKTTSIGFKKALERLVDGDSEWVEELTTKPKCRCIHSGRPVTKRTKMALEGFDGASPIRTIVGDDGKIIFDRNEQRFEVYDTSTDPVEQENIFDSDKHDELIRAILEDEAIEADQLLESAILEEIDI